MNWSPNNIEDTKELKKRYLYEREINLKGYWERLVEWYNYTYNEKIGKEAMRSKVKKYVLPILGLDVSIKETKTGEQEKLKEPGRVGFQELKNGELEYTDVFYFSKEDKETPNSLLKRLGHDPVTTKLCFWQFSNWRNGADDGKRILQACKYRIKPREDILFDEVSFLENIKDLLKSAPKDYNFNFNNKKVKGLDDKLITVAPGIELHYGKIAWIKETGDTYNLEIAEQRFDKSIEAIVKEQQNIKANKLYYAIGNDIFNSDSKGATTKGTPQHDQAGDLELFLNMVEMQKSAIDELAKHYNEVEIILTKSNHDYFKVSYLYIALMQRYENNKKVTFRDDFAIRQCISFGNNVIFLGHGDSNESRTISNLATEFPKEWAKGWYREAIFGHLHSKSLKQSEQGGVFIRRVGSPTGTDKWHKDNSWIGAVPSYQFITYREDGGVYGLKNVYFADRQKRLLK